MWIHGNHHNLPKYKNINMTFVFQAKVQRSYSHSSSSRKCMEGLWSQLASFGKQITGKRSTISEPLPMDYPVQDFPSFYDSTKSHNEGRTSWERDSTGGNLSVIADACFEAQSPDEAALVHAAKAYGFALKERTPHHVTVQLPQGTILKFEVLDVLAFDSTRRRMSVIVRHPLTNEIVMYTKGADSGIMERLQNSFKGRIQRHVLPAIINQYMLQKEQQKKHTAFFALIPLGKPHLKVESRKIAHKTQKDLDMYARDGLRTLCFTRKVQYASFHLHYIPSMVLSVSQLSVTGYHVVTVTSLLTFSKYRLRCMHMCN